MSVQFSSTRVWQRHRATARDAMALPNPSWLASALYVAPYFSLSHASFCRTCRHLVSVQFRSVLSLCTRLQLITCTCATCVARIQVSVGCTTASPTQYHALFSAADHTSSSTRPRDEFCSAIIAISPHRIRQQPQASIYIQRRRKRTAAKRARWGYGAPIRKRLWHILDDLSHCRRQKVGGPQNTTV